MMDLYKQQTEDPEDMSLTFKSKDRFSANVARSFPHIGKCLSVTDPLSSLFYETGYGWPFVIWNLDRPSPGQICSL